MINVHGNSKIDRDTVRAIYLRVLQTQDRVRDIAEAFGVTHLMVCNIANRRSHRFITEDLPDVSLRTRPKKPRANAPYKKTALTEAAVREIRAKLKAGHQHKALAQEYDVTRQVITAINIRRTWKHA